MVHGRQEQFGRQEMTAMPNQMRKLGNRSEEKEREREWRLYLGNRSLGSTDEFIYIQIRR